MEVHITITDKGVIAEHGTTPGQAAAAPMPGPAAFSGAMDPAAATAGGAINAGPAPAMLAATTGGSDAPEAFIAALGGPPAATAGDAESAGPAPNF